jgi:tetratricopeptide (TPR) repeat protein
LETLAAAFLSFRNKDAFELLGVTPETPPMELAPAFLAKADALSPRRFVHPDARNRAESLLLAYARAYGALSDPDQHALHRKRHENALLAKKKATPDPRTAAEQFKIRTTLLDAGAQFDEGKRRFESGQLESAAEHFQCAADIEPNGRTLAYLAITQFRLAPEFAGERSLTALATACQRDPNCEEAWAFRGDLALGLSRHPEAAAAYREALRINPKHPRYRQALETLKKK